MLLWLTRINRYCVVCSVWWQYEPGTQQSCNIQQFLDTLGKLRCRHLYMYGKIEVISIKFKYFIAKSFIWGSVPHGKVDSARGRLGQVDPILSSEEGTFVISVVQAKGRAIAEPPVPGGPNIGMK